MIEASEKQTVLSPKTKNFFSFKGTSFPAKIKADSKKISLGFQVINSETYNLYYSVKFNSLFKTKLCAGFEQESLSLQFTELTKKQLDYILNNVCPD